jgi:GTPase involved in cell partitioning and DNA repair
LIQGLQGQLQQQQQQMMAMNKELSDRQADRNVMLTQIDKKHEADMVKIAATLQAKMEEVAAKREATMHGTIGRQLADIGKAVQEFTKQQQQNSSLQSESASPAQQQTLPAGSPG